MARRLKMRRIILSLFVLIAVLTSLSAYAQTNKVLSLDGDGDYVELPFIPLNDRSFTIEMWIQSNLSTSQEMILSQTHQAGVMNKGLHLRINKDGSIRMGFWGNDLDTNAGVINIGRWYHLAFCFDYLTEPYSRKIYVNGEQKASDTPEFAYQGTSGKTIFGAWEVADQFFYGAIDEVRIWNVVRTQEQIQTTMNTTLSGTETGLVGYWNFDDGTADGLTENHNDGTLYGDAKIVDQYFVLPSGDDSNDGSKEHPFRTIQYAISQSGRDDMITVLPGTYEEQITLVSDLVLQGSGEDDTIITMSSGNVVTASNVHNVTLSGFTIDGQGTADNGILCSGSTSEIEISNNVIIGTTDGILCSEEANAIIEYNTIKDMSYYGILTQDTSEASVTNNIIESCKGFAVRCIHSASMTICNNKVRFNRYGINCTDDTNAEILYNNVEENTDWGISCRGNSNVNIEKNVVCNNESYGIVFLDNTVVKVDNNFVLNNISGLSCRGFAKVNIVRNSISNNRYGIIIEEKSDVSIGGSVVDANNILDNKYEEIINHTSNTIIATYNYWGADDESEIENMMHNGGDGSIVFKPFIGEPDVMKTEGTFTIPFYKGLNMVSLPNHPNTSYTAKTFSERIGDVTMLIRYDKESERFDAYLPKHTKNEGFMIEGGQGYVVNVTESKEVDFTGTVWDNAYAAPLFEKDTSGKVWAFVIAGKLLSDLRNTENLTISIYNENRNIHRELSLSNSEFCEVFLDADRHAVVEAGDKFSLEVTNVDGSLVAEMNITVKSTDLIKAYKIINLVYNPIPNQTALLQNYPNPFNPETWIPFKLSDDAKVVVSIYDVEGQLVRKIGLGKMPAGMYLNKDKAVYWDGCNNAGEKVSSGLYFYTIHAGEYRATKRMLILK